jgi:hypothetical protein
MSGLAAHTQGAVSGTIDCTGVTGAVVFKPPLTASGGSAETDTINIVVTGCTASAGSSASPTKGRVTGQLPTPSNSCASLITNTSPIHLKVVWSPKKDGQTAGTFSGFTLLLTPTLGFSLPNTGGGVTANGSYTGSDGGASSTATAFSNVTQSQALTTCANSGLKKLTITTGTVHIG